MTPTNITHLRTEVKMKRKKLIIILSAVLATFILGGVIVYAASYDSTSDPLVALSYLNSVFKPSIDKDIKSVSDRVTTAEGKISSIEKAISSGNIGSGSPADSAEVEELKKALEGVKADLDAAEKEIDQLTSDKATKTELAELAKTVEEQNARVDGLFDAYGDIVEALLAERIPAAENYGYKTVTLKKGQMLLCNNYVSVLLKGGGGTYKFEGVGYDATASEDIASGDSAVLEHIAVFETGVVFEATADTTVMVKGEYTVER